jgi:hypothetical protein
MKLKWVKTKNGWQVRLNEPSDTTKKSLTSVAIDEGVYIAKAKHRDTKEEVVLSVNFKATEFPLSNSGLKEAKTWFKKWYAKNKVKEEAKHSELSHALYLASIDEFEVVEPDDPDVELMAFEKIVLYEGEWKHPTTGQKVKFDRNRLEASARTTNKFIKAGNIIPFPLEHTTDPDKSMGEWSRFRVDDPTPKEVAASPFLAGKKVVRARAEVPLQEHARMVGTTIKRVSPWVRRNYAHSDGATYDNLLHHVAATSYPVIPGQTNFTRASDGARTPFGNFKLSSGDKVVSVLSMLPCEAGGENSMEWKDFLLSLLGITDKSISDDELTKKAKEFFSQGKGTSVDDTQLSVKDDDSDEVKALKEQLSATRQDTKDLLQLSATNYVNELKNKSAKAGKPIDADKLKRIEQLYLSGGANVQIALELGEAWLSASEALNTPTEPLTKEQEEEHLSVKKQDIAAQARALRSKGYTVELNSDETEILSAVLPKKK